MNSLVKNMNTEQSEAVRTTEGPLLIMAGGVRENTRINTSYCLFIR